MHLLSCHHLTLGYEGKTVVSDLSFTVDAGDYLCIVGENGSGKSTLLKTLLGLNSPMAGDIVAAFRATEIGYLPQQTVAQKDFPASVREVVLSGCLNRCGLRPFYNREEKRLAEETMTRLGISDLAARCYRELSGGQQQRALLARAVCATQKILFLDEPGAGLDPHASEEMYELIRKLNDEGITMIIVSHDVAASVKHASHILHFGNQTALFFGTTADYLKSEIGHIYGDGEEVRA